MPKIKTTDAQRKLAVLWLIAAGIPISVMGIQTVMGRFDDRAQEAWGWLLPTVVPTLTLVVGTVVANARKKQVEKPVDAFFWKLALGVSVFYLAFVTVVLLATSMYTSINTTIAAMMQSNLFLGPVQGVVAAVLGVFFVSSAHGKSADDHAPVPENADD